MNSFEKLASLLGLMSSRREQLNADGHFTEEFVRLNMLRIFPAFPEAEK